MCNPWVEHYMFALSAISAHGPVASVYSPVCANFSGAGVLEPGPSAGLL